MNSQGGSVNAIYYLRQFTVSHIELFTVLRGKKRSNLVIQDHRLPINLLPDILALKSHPPLVNSRMAGRPLLGKHLELH